MTALKQLQAIELQTTIPALETDLIATQNILEVVEWAKKHKQQMDNVKKVYDEACEIIKAYMQSAETLISEDGARLVTWNIAANKLQLDVGALRREFNDVYLACCNEVPGNRSFLLK